MPVVSSRADDAQDAVGVDQERHLQPRHAGGHRRNPRSLKRASERQSSTISRSPCTTCRSNPVWLSAYVVNVCVGAGGDGRVAMDQLLDHAAHHLEAERQRHDVEQQHVAVSGAAGEHVGLHRGAERDDLVGIDVGQRLAPEQLLHELAHQRHARRAADQDHAVEAGRGVSSASLSARRTGRRSGSSTGRTSAPSRSRVSDTVASVPSGERA